jgi:hypothetical protein
MSRMRGERQQDFNARSSFEATRSQATLEWESKERQLVEVDVACGCSAYLYPHNHSAEWRRREKARFEREIGADPWHR